MDKYGQNVSKEGGERGGSSRSLRRKTLSNPESREAVVFHPEQIKYLEKIFPEVVLGPASTEAELRYYNGQRSVLHFIRSKQRK